MTSDKLRRTLAMSLAVAVAACGGQPSNSSTSASPLKSGNSAAGTEQAATDFEQRLAGYPAFKLNQSQLADRYTSSYQACLDDSTGGSGGVECAANEMKAQDGRLNAVYQSLIRTFVGGPGEGLLRQDERAWIKSRDKSCHENGDGTMYREVEAGCIVDETIRRAEFLRSLSSSTTPRTPDLHTPALVSAGLEAAATGQRKAWQVGGQKGYAVPSPITKVKGGSCRKVSFTLIGQPAQPAFGELPMCGNVNGEWGEGNEPSEVSLDPDADQD